MGEGNRLKDVKLFSFFENWFSSSDVCYGSSEWTGKQLDSADGYRSVCECVSGGVYAQQSMSYSNRNRRVIKQSQHRRQKKRCN